MPYPNEHACRIKDPGDFEADSFRRIEGGEGKDKLNIVIGRLRGKTTTTTQAFRYPIDTWDEARAKAHCAEQEGRFEAAAPSEESFAAIPTSDEGFEEGATIKSMVQHLLRSAKGVATHPNVPRPVKAKIQDLQNLLHHTWADISAEGVSEGKGNQEDDTEFIEDCEAIPSE